mmetsp:Transcript_7828/g.13196  ORF Transcript_7828/g.13196 Transcript_7828/m.13196 type:complete len:256 (-) Transcript_7828:179-946(-)
MQALRGGGSRGVALSIDVELLAHTHGSARHGALAVRAVHCAGGGGWRALTRRADRGLMHRVRQRERRRLETSGRALGLAVIRTLRVGILRPRRHLTGPVVVGLNAGGDLLEVSAVGSQFHALTRQTHQHMCRIGELLVQFQDGLLSVLHGALAPLEHLAQLLVALLSQGQRSIAVRQNVLQGLGRQLHAVDLFLALLELLARCRVLVLQLGPFAFLVRHGLVAILHQRNAGIELGGFGLQIFCQLGVLSPQVPEL